MTLDTELLFAGLITEAAVVGFSIYRRIYRTLPFFFAYLIWSLIGDAGQYVLIRLFPRTEAHPNTDLIIYAVDAVIDALFMFGVLLELSMSVLRPIRAALPRWVMPAIALVILAISAAIWPFAKSPGFELLTVPSQLQIHLELTLSVLRILFFLALAGLSQLLSIGWRDRELQIATGFGVYSLATLSAALLHTSQTVGNEALNSQFHVLDQMASATYICSMIYWCICFFQRVPERREFTPQMQSFLLAMAGNARSARMALTHPDSKPEKAGNRRGD